MRKCALIMICVVLTGLVIVLYMTIKTSTIRELHMVEVLSKDADRVYTVSIPMRFNPEKLRDQIVTIRLCAQGDDLPLKRDMVIQPFQYIQLKDCLLINQNTFDDWLRDSHRNVIDKNGNQLFSGGS